MNFTETEYINLYLTFSPKYTSTNKYKFDIKEDYLDCQTLIGLSICKIYPNNFPEQKSNDYNLHYYSQEDSFSLIYELRPFKVIIPEKEIINIGLPDEDNKDLLKIGQNGIIYLKTNYKDSQNKFNQSDLERFTFTGQFSTTKESKLYNSDCNLWKPSNGNLKILCQLKENLPKGDNSLYLQELNINYKENYKIIIKSDIDGIKVRQLEESIAFIYSDETDIEIKKETEKYILTFNYKNYNNEPLYLYKNDIKYIKLNTCNKKENSKLECEVTKDDLLPIVSYNGEIFSLAQRIENEGLYIFNSVLGSKIVDKIEQKTEIKINNLTLLTPSLSKNEFIAYETNVADVEKLITDYFTIKTNKSQELNCIFKKNEKMNLLLLCNAVNEGEDSLGELTKYSLEKANILYKFEIEEETTSMDIFNISGDGTKISSVYPLVLNFNEKDSYKIIYETQYPDNFKNIKLNKNSTSDLQCTNKIGYIECNVDKDHFSQKDDYYHTYHKHNEEMVIAYEVPLIHVILKDKGGNNTSDNDDDGDKTALIVGLSVAGAIVLAILLFFIIHYIRKNKIGTDSSSKIEEEAKQLLEVTSPSDVKEGQEGP